MNRVNPCYVLRRHLLDRVIAAAGQGDFSELRLWLALLHGRIGASLAASTGVETFREVVKYLMAGADVVMTTSSLLRHGPEHLVRLREGLTEWLLERDYSSVADLRGCMSLDRVPDASAYERANYIRILEEFEPPEVA